MILAHGSGIDDVLLFVVPVLIALVLLRMAERKARRRAETTDSTSDPTGAEVPPLSSPADE